jgi:16S rRNA (guanine527-N7)-methyltransferase
MVLKQFIEEVKNNFKNVDDKFFDNIEIYKQYLQEYNKATNLTRLDGEDKIYQEYFLESILPFINIDFAKYTKVLDIGSGSGIPGIVLKLLYPQIDLTIIESNGKKLTFMRSLASKLNINVTFYLKRAEEIRNNEREKYDIVTSRAVAELRIILEVSVPYCKVNGLIIEPKGRMFKEEYAEAEQIIGKLGIKLISEKDNSNFVFEKVEVTNQEYPRK